MLEGLQRLNQVRLLDGFWDIAKLNVVSPGTDLQVCKLELNKLELFLVVPRGCRDVGVDVQAGVTLLYCH